jgi:hypothetical protein
MFFHEFYSHHYALASIDYARTLFKLARISRNSAESYIKYDEILYLMRRNLTSMRPRILAALCHSRSSKLPQDSPAVAQALSALCASVNQSLRKHLPVLAQSMAARCSIAKHRLRSRRVSLRMVCFTSSVCFRNFVRTIQPNLPYVLGKLYVRFTPIFLMFYPKHTYVFVRLIRLIYSILSVY